MEYIPYGRQYIDQDDIDSVIQVLKSDWLTQGPKVKEFEEAVAAYHGCSYAVAFCNGTAALHGAYYVSTQFPFGGKGKTIETNSHNGKYWEYITSPITFVASSNGGLYCGGTPKFVDIEPNTYCIDIEKIEDAVTADTRVITPVSYAGYPVDIEAVKNLPKVKENNLCIIHDACHAIGARINGCGIADFADMTILSFHPVKHVTTGEGGMVLTNNYNYYKKLLLFRNHGITKDKDDFINQDEGDWYYEMQELGYNYRITDLQCALGISQMRKLDSFLFRRNQIAKLYETELGELEWIRTAPGLDKSWLIDHSYNGLKRKPDNLHSYHLFPILLDKDINRRGFFDYMRKNGIGVQIHYIPVNRQQYYNCETLQLSDDFYSRQISLPMYYGYSEQDLYKVVGIIRDFAK